VSFIPGLNIITTIDWLKHGLKKPIFPVVTSRLTNQVVIIFKTGIIYDVKAGDILRQGQI
jgi:hypothetical protein